jgi:hypothetical protein
MTSKHGVGRLVGRRQSQAILTGLSEEVLNLGVFATERLRTNPFSGRLEPLERTSGHHN